MPSAPVNVYTEKTANKVAKVRVFVGPADGSDDDFTESFDLIPFQVSITAGSQPDFAVFEYKTDRFVEVADATETITSMRDEITFNRQVYIRVEDRRDKDNSRVLFWGELLSETLHIDPQSQRITIAARVAPYHFGTLLEGEYHWDVTQDAEQLVAVDPVFNPLIDGIIEGNHAMIGPGFSFRPLTADNSVGGDELWVDPDAVRTDEAKETIGEPIDGSGSQVIGELWKLHKAVRVISRRLYDSEYITKPEVPEEETPPADSIWEDQPEIKNFRLPRGRHLNEYLDALLTPHGYGWYLDHSAFSDLKPEIIIFRRGEGVKRSVKLQATGEELDMAKTNAAQIDLVTDVGDLANKIYGWGSFEQKELTIELYRGWAEADDSLTAEDLRKSEPESEYNASDKHTPWRLWVANEAGDYTGTRTVTQPISDYLDLSTVFGKAVPTRRKIDDCLTLDEQKKRRIPYLEWSDDDGATWAEVPPGWSWVILPDQIGIRFSEDTPPEELIDAGDEAKVRITGTVTGDERLNGTAEPSLDESPNLREVPLFLDLSDRFHKRSVQEDGDLTSTLFGDANGADTANDQTELDEYLEEMLATELSAKMQTGFRLHGIHTDYEISDLIISVDGRDLFLNRNKYNISPTSDAAKRYPQIYGITWLFQEQATVLMMEGVQ